MALYQCQVNGERVPQFDLRLLVVPRLHSERAQIAPTNLFRIPGTIEVVAGSRNIYKADRDGQRFLVAVKSQVTNVPPIRVILNWPELLTGK